MDELRRKYAGIDATDSSDTNGTASVADVDIDGMEVRTNNAMILILLGVALDCGYGVHAVCMFHDCLTLSPKKKVVKETAIMSLV